MAGIYASSSIYKQIALLEGSVVDTTPMSIILISIYDEKCETEFCFFPGFLCFSLPAKVAGNRREVGDGIAHVARARASKEAADT